MPNFSCVVSAELFARAWNCVSKEETRYYLNGVRVESCPEGGALLIATDGAGMVVLRDPVGIVEGSAIVSLTPDMLKACKAKRTLNSALVVKEGKALVAWGVSGDEYLGALEGFDLGAQNVNCVQMRDIEIDGTYPDWRWVIPSSVEAEHAIGSFDISMLARLAAALSEGKPFLRLVSSGGRNDPHFALATSSVGQGFGVAMPIRDGGAENPVRPSWIDAAPQAVAAE